MTDAKTQTHVEARLSPTSRTETDTRIIRFVEQLSSLEPGERARLKRNAGATLAEARSAIGLFYRILPPNVPSYQHEMYFLLATLYPTTEAAQTGSFGHALRLAQDERNSAGLDRRMEHILDADEVQLSFRLRQAVHYLYSQRVGVDWEQLLHDLLRWSHPQRHVQRRWAADYFARQSGSSRDNDHAES